ncbi:ElyC/SanA/YdcF family protein [Halomonas sp. YLGW01]|uniref:SanA/YdcF family protein n=1 Tax=Halomonas sp. YLGW01 TaxID=2773308 RepID=UPI001F5BBBA2|nr:ElyC/SanA/YdcF family protein [Halomonas sp. YLGW01]
MYLKWAKALRVVLMLLGALVVCLALVGAVASLWMVERTRGRIDHQLSQCVQSPVGIVFGTSLWSRQGGRNPYFAARIEAAAALMRERRVDHLLLSGDNRTRYYNEPVSMWRELRARRVRDVDMTLDYAGFSTFDTLVRAQAVFGVERALLISQDWHLPRAMFIADALGLEVEGCAVQPEAVDGGWRLRAREWLARLATLGDLYLWGRKAYFLGPEEPLEVAPPPRVSRSAVAAAIGLQEVGEGQEVRGGRAKGARDGVTGAGSEKAASKKAVSAPLSAVDTVPESASGSPSSSAR